MRSRNLFATFALDLTKGVAVPPDTLETVMMNKILRVVNVAMSLAVLLTLFGM